MRIAEVAGTIAVHAHYDLVVLGAHACRIALRPAETWTPVVGGPEVRRPSFERDFLALSPTGERVDVRRRVTRMTADRYGLEDTKVVDELSVIDLATRIVSVPGRGGRVRHRRGDARRPTARRRNARIPHRGVRRSGAYRASSVQRGFVAIAPRSIWRGPLPWQDGGPSSRATATSNPAGHVVADSLSGLVVRIEDDPARMTACRVPSEGEQSGMEIRTFATAAGFVVAHVVGRGGGALNHFSTSGAHLGALSVSGNLSDVVVLPTQLIFLREKADFSGNFELVVATLPGITSALDPFTEPLEHAVTKPNKTGITVHLVALAWRAEEGN